jgi:hypothetical protein
MSLLLPIFLPSKSPRAAQIEGMGNETLLLKGRKSKEFAAIFNVPHHNTNK